MIMDEVTLSTASQAVMWKALRDLRGVQTTLANYAHTIPNIDHARLAFLEESAVMLQAIDSIRGALEVSGFDIAGMPV